MISTGRLFIYIGDKKKCVRYPGDSISFFNIGSFDPELAIEPYEGIGAIHSILSGFNWPSDPWSLMG